VAFVSSRKDRNLFFLFERREKGFETYYLKSNTKEAKREKSQQKRKKVVMLEMIRTE